MDIRGSKKHILDLVENPNFTAKLSQILNPTSTIIKCSDKWMPKGYCEPKEARMELFRHVLPKTDYEALHNWWLVHKRGANTPNWDLISTCTIHGKKGLVIVEAKAHTNELKTDGKILSSNASTNSQENDKHIGKAICEASQALANAVKGVKISKDTHYQLANRVAFSWKIASLGVPVVLVYLGFIGDKNMWDVGEPFGDDNHWQEVMQNYMEGHIPRDFPDHLICCGKSSMQMLIRSLPIADINAL